MRVISAADDMRLQGKYAIAAPVLNFYSNEFDNANFMSILNFNGVNCKGKCMQSIFYGIFLMIIPTA